MKNKKLGIALLTLAVFTNVQTKDKARSREGVYQPKTPWPLVVVEEVAVGTAGVITLGQTDADPTALPMAIPDAIPGVSYARTKDNDSDESCSSTKRVRKEKPAKAKKEKSCKKSCDSTKKTTRTKKAKCNDGHPAEVIVLPVAVAADVVTLDTQEFTRQTVESINGTSDTEYAAE